MIHFNGTSDDGRALLSSTFLALLLRCETILLFYLNVRLLCERRYRTPAMLLLENTNVTYPQLETEEYTRSFARHNTCVPVSAGNAVIAGRRFRREVRSTFSLWQHREMLSCFACNQESTSIRNCIELPYRGRPSNLVLENMLRHTQSLRSLCLRIPSETPHFGISARSSSSEGYVCVGMW
jgi:hypothetical protein